MNKIKELYNILAIHEATIRECKRIIARAEDAAEVIGYLHDFIAETYQEIDAIRDGRETSKATKSKRKTQAKKRIESAGIDMKRVRKVLAKIKGNPLDAKKGDEQ